MKTLIIFLLAALTASAAEPAPAGLQRLAKSDRSGTASSVRVPDGPFVFTGQVFAAEAIGGARTQVDRALASLATTLAKAGSDLARVVRLAAYVADGAAVAEVEAAVAARFAEAPPAFVLIRTPLAVPGAQVAFEAVATSARTASAVEVLDASAAVLPAGGKIFISGQAIRGTDMASAVKLTMAGLHRSLAHVGLNKSDVVQVKAFIQPFADHAAAVREIAGSFDCAPVPPVVVMEWVSGLFAEIELVASARSLRLASGVPITYLWLPWLTPSGRYCHVTHVAAGTPLIFLGAIDGGDGADSRAQMKTIFERLGSALFDAGSSYRHMAKATYYLSDVRARTLLGEIRDVYYDPTRAPAASALEVKGFGRAGRAAMLDMIAVPAK